MKTRLVSGGPTYKNNDKGKEKDMEFLKEILGEELFNQMAEKINAHNGNEANKDNQIKIGNLGTGEYVSAAKHKALQDAMGGKDAELENANNLIAELQKASKGNEEMQQKFKDYETANAELQKQLQETKVKYAFDVMLMDAGVTDKDEREFLAYKYESKLKEEGKTLELDENEHIKGSEAIIDSMKTMRPKAFESASNSDGFQVMGDNRLPQNDNRTVKPTKEQFRQMSYEERLAIKQKNEQLYKELAK